MTTGAATFAREALAALGGPEDGLASPLCIAGRLLAWDRPSAALGTAPPTWS